MLDDLHMQRKSYISKSAKDLGILWREMTMTPSKPITELANGDDRLHQRPRKAAEDLNSLRTSTSISSEALDPQKNGHFHVSGWNSGI